MTFKHLHKHIACAAILVSLPATALAQGSEKSVWLEKDTLQCVIDNADNYLALDKDPVLVFFDLCPKAEPSEEEFLSFATNSLPSIKVSAGEGNATVTRVAALRKSEIQCLVKMMANKETPDASDDQVQTDIVKISFGGCAVATESD